MPHIHEKYDFTVTAFIVNTEAKVLLVNHPRYNKWIPVGGHIELDEDPDEALFKEIREETGLVTTPLTTKLEIDSPGTKFLLTPNYVDVHEANPPHKHISFIYFMRTESNDFKISDEHTDMRWFTEFELDDEEYTLDPSITYYAKEAIMKAQS